MKERPILFSAPMVRAILAGTKTQTRREIKPHRADDAFALVEHTDGWWPYRSEDGESISMDDGCEYPLVCPYGQPGDRLWVREAHCFLDVTKSALSQFPLGPENGNAVGPDVWNLVVEYSDGTEHETSVEGDKPKETRQRGECGWRPSIHMPRWASRITLEVVAVRVEQLRDISETDAIAEGILAQRGDGLGPGMGFKWSGMGYHGAGFVKNGPWKGERTYHTPKYTGVGCSCHVAGPTPAQCAYRELWESINGAGSWAANQWVWVVEFKRLTP